MKFINISKNYQRLFHFEGMDYLMNTIHIWFYKSLDGLITVVDDDFYIWLPKAVLDAQLDEGAKFFANQKKFDAYYNSHVAFLKAYQSAFRSEIKEPKVLNFENVKIFLELARRSISFFYKTEFFYTDKAYQLAEANPVIRKNLMKNYKLKEKSRVIVFNDAWFSGDSYLSLLRKKLAKQFDVNATDLKYYGVDDIYQLFNGKKVNVKILVERKRARILLGKNGVEKVFIGRGVREEIINFLKTSGEQTPSNLQTIKGVSASRGRVRGRVKIIISDPKTFDSLSHQIAQMKKGDILVAETTSPEFMTACQKASAILANQGGLLSHAAVVSRELGIPCIVGLRYATKILKDGDLVGVDAERGIVKILKRAV